MIEDRRVPRLLIFVIAYHAESTLEWVLDRIPPTIHQEFDTEILVVDDASQDRTYLIGREYQARHADLPLTVLRNRYNQGYGGNQKLGYTYAVDRGFDYVAMVHGDGQYAPEELPALVQPLLSGEADAVFGSRMLVPGAARAGGMPSYKYLGNRILTWTQNRILGTDFSEFHSGYRVYSVSALRKIPFTLNSNEFHFDTEVILQLLNAGQRIVELPIPTYYGSEISRVNGMAYAWNVVLATIKNWFHRSGLLYRRRFDPLVPDNSHYEVKLGYPSSHDWALRAVPDGASVMDLGAGPGELAVELVRKGCRTTVVDRFPPRHAPPGVDVVVQDLDRPLTFDASGAEYILMLDVIEHLTDPELFLDRLRSGFGYEPKHLILTTPNVAFVVQRLTLALGQFNYGKSGILDRTHTRLFTFRSIRSLLRDAGFRFVEIRGIPAPFPKAIGENAVSRFLLAVNLALIRVSKTLFSYQIFIRADSTPDVNHLLDDATRFSTD
jgi:glycosyltransferase involved in cell wall biosynthesis